MTDLLKVFDSMQFDNKDIGYNSRVLIVDALNTFMRSYAAIPSLDEDGNHIGGMAGFMKSLGFAIRSFKPTRVVLVFMERVGHNVDERFTRNIRQIGNHRLVLIGRMI